MKQLLKFIILQCLVLEDYPRLSTGLTRQQGLATERRQTGGGMAGRHSDDTQCFISLIYHKKVSLSFVNSTRANGYSQKSVTLAHFLTQLPSKPWHLKFFALITFILDVSFGVCGTSRIYGTCEV
jgi:hypothetical protein